MKNKWYWAFKNIFFGPILRIYNRPVIVGAQNIPESGAAVLASNHQSVMDSFFLPLLCKRQITFPAKQEYFTSPGVVGRLQKWFFTAVGQIPLDRTSSDALEALTNAASSVLGAGELFGIYPEGTRSPDGRVYRGKTGMARVALLFDAPIIPVAMVGARDANPIGSWVIRPKKVEVRIGAAIDPVAFVVSQGLERESHEAARVLTDHVMRVLADLAGEEYVDVYASEVKKSLEEGKGYPPGAQRN
ncbi:lysophospholipid acyltransferase family protein [Corynebacterium felinum]|uniref:1-acyl-sn-glycerol-3-phosphate acyltransferase n=1 Tax=Corynebacterium felinum TaxID=131318 RepID=A0ABU2BBZ7_9CORY|nr:lysophospholipid acyltransferase family protein [Corynebacterium felinum]MDF5821320.1 lysophospholipid acyltransferase family protein [Corynebacterium felinum]MDR7356162.1 1-acyl-sn-glycerol-3-phosphate acyltransferase [Corynebacterium felinum]WJY95496.1 2-acyl-glycerophospho-ethanolamine acyltransferase [Corynebacterium felinum]